MELFISEKCPLIYECDAEELNYLGTGFGVSQSWIWDLAQFLLNLGTIIILSGPPVSHLYVGIIPTAVVRSSGVHIKCLIWFLTWLSINKCYHYHMTTNILPQAIFFNLNNTLWFVFPPQTYYTTGRALGHHSVCFPLTEVILISNLNCVFCFHLSHCLPDPKINHCLLCASVF